MYLVVQTHFVVTRFLLFGSIPNLSPDGLSLLESKHTDMPIQMRKYVQACSYAKRNDQSNLKLFGQKTNPANDK